MGKNSSVYVASKLHFVVEHVHFAARDTRCRFCSQIVTATAHGEERGWRVVGGLLKNREMLTKTLL